MNTKVLNSQWYTTCDGETIGIVKTEDTITGEIKYRIGTGLGLNETDDIQKIVSMGSRFYPEFILGGFMDINLLNNVQDKIDKCYVKYDEYASFAEAMSILREEFEELWQECKRKELDFTKIKTEITDNLAVLFKMYDDIVVKENRR